MSTAYQERSAIISDRLSIPGRVGPRNLAAWNIPWPPPAGWVHALIHLEREWFERHGIDRTAVPDIRDSLIGPFVPTPLPQPISRYESEELRQVEVQANLRLAEFVLTRRLEDRGFPEREVTEWIEALRGNHARVAKLIESPIEDRLLPWLLIMPTQALRTKVIATSRPDEDQPVKPRGLFIVPQFMIGRCRLDFAVIAQMPSHTRIIAVECDGRDFHYAPRDAARDRYLKAFGVQTVRATGAEIMRSPERVAEKVGDVVSSIWAVGVTI